MKKSPLDLHRNLLYLTQLGLSLAMPLLLCIFGAAWLRQRFDLGNWVVLLGIVLGFGGSAVTFRDVYRSAVAKARRESKEPRSFNKRW